MVYNQREYLWLKGGVFSFSRHVPNDVQICLPIVRSGAKLAWMDQPDERL